MYGLKVSRLGQRKATEGSHVLPLVHEALSLVYQITNGNVDYTMTERFSKSELGPAFLAMQNYIRSIIEQKKEHEWLNSRVAHMSEVLRNTEREEMSPLLNRALIELVRSVGAVQGSIFALVSAEAEAFLDRVAAYAVERQKQSAERIPAGIGLIGQCVLEKTPVYLTDLPAGYLKISSGLGECKPGSLLIVPLVWREESIGAIELAFLKPVKEHEKEMVSKCADITASIMLELAEKEKMQNLLALAQRQASALKEKEVLMQHNLERMQAMQEQLERNEHDLKDRLKTMEQELENERRKEIFRMREEEKMLLESKLETQRKSYELIINRLKEKIGNTTA